MNASEADPMRHASIARIPRVKKNVLASPPQATSKFKRRQVNKTWLPTHLWHTKRAHMTRPTEPLWRMALPLQPTEKTYRPIHRASGSRGCVAWDTSYMSTIGCWGTQVAIEGMLRALSFAPVCANPIKQHRWKAGTRFAEGWIRERDSQKRFLAQITVIWRAIAVHVEEQIEHRTADLTGETKQARKGAKLDKRLFIIVHPSAFHIVWQEILKVAKMQKPQVLVADLRFEIGSISVTGPESTEALTGVLRPVSDDSELEGLWNTLSSMRNPAALPINAMLAFDMVDPRYDHPPKRVRVTRDDEKIQKLNELIVTWPTMGTVCSSRLFDQKERYVVRRSLQSQKAINRRKAAVATGQSALTFAKDPRIPVILLAHRSSKQDSNAQGSWTVLMPWSCVDLVWRSLMCYALSSGNTPRFGGLEQTQQVAFEHTVPWFPGDFPGLEAGKAWDRTESQKRFDAWIRRPASKRFAYDAVDLGLGRKGELGRGWACDWEYLFRDTVLHSLNVNKTADDEADEHTSKIYPHMLTQRQRRAAAKVAKNKEEQARRRNTSSPETEDEKEQWHNNVKYAQLDSAEAIKLFTSYSREVVPSDPALATVRIKLLVRGTPKAAARIYRLPADIDKTECISLITNRDKHTKTSDARHSPNVEVSSRPFLFSDTPLQSRPSASRELRQRWLRLDPLLSGYNPSSAKDLLQPVKKERRNHHGDIIAHKVFDPKHTNDLSHIRVFPPRETNPKVLDVLGPRPPPKTDEDRLKMIQPQLVPKLRVNNAGELIEEDIWDRHVPSPGKEDLIGFVTTGGYNLAEGRGMAIGSIWMQRIIQGWKDEDKQKLDCDEQGTTESNSSARAEVLNVKVKTTWTKQQVQDSKEDRRTKKQIDRQKHLCVVRNAGESVGRLATWEVC